MVVGRRHLDHVDPGHRQLVGDPPHRVKQLPGGQPARLRGAGPRRVPRIADIDVNREEHPVAIVHRDPERLGQALGQPPGADLGHLVGAHPLLRHPLQRLRSGPVAAQPHLQEPVAAERARLDQPPHRLAVADQRSELDVPGVRVRVEVDHRDPALPAMLGHARGVGPGDRVVAAEHERDRARRGHRVDRLLQVAHRPGGVAGEQLDVARVVDPQVLQRVDAQRERRPRPVVRQVAGLPDVLRPEPGAGPVRGAAVERRAQDHYVGVGVRIRRRPVAAVDAEEGDVRAELGSVAGHGRSLGYRSIIACSRHSMLSMVTTGGIAAGDFQIDDPSPPARHPHPKNLSNLFPERTLVPPARPADPSMLPAQPAAPKSAGGDPAQDGGHEVVEDLGPGRPEYSWLVISIAYSPSMKNWAVGSASASGVPRPAPAPARPPRPRGHHRVLGPLVGAGQHLRPPGGEVQPEHLAEQRLADPPLHRREQPDDLGEGGGQEPRAGAGLELGQELRQLGDQPGLLVPLELGQDVLLGRDSGSRTCPGRPPPPPRCRRRRPRPCRSA